MKRILLAVCGTSPQVITETIHALYMQGRTPDAVRILTTREGKDRCIAGLFGADDGAFFQWLAEYGIPRASIDFAPCHVRAVQRADGTAMEDILDEEDNALFLAACMQNAFELTGLADRTVYFSLSGGRKTMSACLATAAQFYARPQDRIFHVLLTPEFESNRNFYFPPRDAKEITLKDAQGQPYAKSTEHARINLISLPIVSIRDRISPGHLQQPESPADLLASLIREPLPVLTLDLRERKVVWRGIECDLSPALLALYAFFALTKKEASCREEECTGCRCCFVDKQQVVEQSGRIADLYRRIAPARDFDAMSRTGILNLGGDTPEIDNFKVFHSRLNRTLKESFGSEAARLIIDGPDVRPKRYGIALPKGQLRVVS